SKAQLIALYEPNFDPLPGKSAEQKTAVLKKTSYRDYLIKVCGCGVEVADCFQGRTLDYFAVGCDAVSAWEARGTGDPGFAGPGLPGFGGLGCPGEKGAAPAEPYIHHFPDGNASIARLLVRSLIPGVAPGQGMEDVVLAPFDYARLDRPDQAVRLRLDSTCL